MYTIKEAGVRTGIAVPLLRAWERRYGIVTPDRSRTGYRLYDDEAIARLRAMRRLVDDGWTPSTASSAILSGDPAALAAGRGPTEEGGPADAGSATAGTGDDSLVDAFLAAAIGLDADATEAVLDRMFGAGSFEHVADEILMPALAAIGDAWADGRLGVAGEHAASHAALRRLAAAYQAGGRPAPSHGAILVGMPPGVRHELGALAFSTAARRARLPVLYLGPDLPVEDWVTTSRVTNAQAAVIGVPTAGDVRPAIDVALALSAADPRLLIAFGGRSAMRARELLAEDPRVGASPGKPHRPPIALPEPLVEAVGALEAALTARP
jgi:methanogenic corrinoid protein MtbC1